MLKEFLALIEINPAMLAAEGFTVQQVAEVLPQELGGNTYPRNQINNIASRLRVFFQTLEELGYLEKCAMDDRRRTTYKFTTGGYSLLSEHSKKPRGRQGRRKWRDRPR